MGDTRSLDYSSYGTKMYKVGPLNSELVTYWSGLVYHILVLRVLWERDLTS